MYGVTFGDAEDGKNVQSDRPPRRINFFGSFANQVAYPAQSGAKRTYHKPGQGYKGRSGNINGTETTGQD